jgi:hypothetical protein
VVLPIPEIGNPTVFSEYRAISLQPCLSRSFVTSHSCHQSLVRIQEYSNKATAVLKVTEEIRSLWKMDKHLILFSMAC